MTQTPTRQQMRQAISDARAQYGMTARRADIEQALDRVMAEAPTRYTRQDGIRQIGECDACEEPSDSLVPLEYDGTDGTRTVAMICERCAPEGDQNDGRSTYD